MLGGRGTTAALVGGAALAAAAAWWVVAGADGEDDVRAGSELVDAAADELLAAQEAPSSYRIDYRVEGYGGDDPVVTSDRLWVRRPFESRLEVFTTPEPGGAPDAVQVAAFGGFRADGKGSDAVVVAAPPGPPASDARLAESLAAAIADGRARVVEHRRVLGRRCHVIRTAVALASGDLAPAGGDGEHADTCIDAQGLVLEELVVSAGEPLLRRVAIELDLAPEVSALDVEVGEPTIGVDEGGGFTAEVEPGSRVPGRFFEPTAPTGFSRRGRYAVIPPQAENFTQPDRRGQRLTYVSDVFVDGADVVVLDQGGTFGDVEPFSELRGVDVELEGGAPLGPATLTYGMAGPAVIVQLGEGDFLRARGTVSPDVLVDLLEGLREVEGGELRLLDPPVRGGPQPGGG